MKPTKPRRARTPVRLSVSVDLATMQALRALADREFAGNLSALMIDLAEEARRRFAEGELLRRFGVAKLTKEETVALEAELEVKVATSREKPPKRKPLAS